MVSKSPMVTRKKTNNYFTEEQAYQIQVFSGILNVVFNLLGLYFVYRWGLTILHTDTKTRQNLIGDPFYSWLGKNEKIIALFVSFYLAFRVVFITINTAQWEIYMRKVRSALIPVQPRKVSLRMQRNDAHEDNKVKANQIYMS